MFNHSVEMRIHLVSISRTPLAAAPTASWHLDSTGLQRFVAGIALPTPAAALYERIGFNAVDVLQGVRRRPHRVVQQPAAQLVQQVS